LFVCLFVCLLCCLDTSRARKKPLRFRIGAEQVPKGLNDGVSLLSKGERAKMNIPAHLGFAGVGVPGLVPPNTNLIYDVELLDFTEH
jgi:FKBP-type peptidyl-prolyl cis-trans isomerase